MTVVKHSISEDVALIEISNPPVNAISAAVSSISKNPACGDAFTRFVPSDSKVERRSALPDAEIPDTATIAAIPMPIPIEVSVALPFLARTPYRATKNKSLVFNLFLFICLQFFHQLIQ